MTSRSLWCLVPVKRPDLAKQRLAPILDADERAGLARAMAGDVLAAAAGARSLAGIAVMTADPLTADRARRAGLRVIDDVAETGTKAAVAAGARILAREGAGGLLVLPVDLPLAQAEDLDALAAAHGDAPSVTMVAAQSDGGSNALACSPPEVIAFHFGADSFARHRQAALACGILPRPLVLPRLAHDIDRPDDLLRFMADPSATLSHAFLASLRDSRRRFAVPQAIDRKGAA